MATLSIRDNLGRVVKSLTLNDQRFDISNLASGIYFITIQQDEWSYDTKVVKK